MSAAEGWTRRGALGAGAALIAGGGIYTAYREGRRGRPVLEALAPPES